MDPRQFVKESNIQIQNSDGTSQNDDQGVQPSNLKIGRFYPGMYNVLINKKFTNEERVNLKYILKQRPRGQTPINAYTNISVSEIKGYYGQFQTGFIHSINLGMKGDLNKNFFSVQFSGYISTETEKKSFSFNVYRNGKIRFSGGFLGYKNLKTQVESLRKYIIDTYTQKQGFLYNEIVYNNVAGQFKVNVNFKLSKIASENPLNAERVSYEAETDIQLPNLYMTYRGHKFVISTKSTVLGSGAIQILGEDNPDNLENAYLVAVEAVKKLHDSGYTMGSVNKNVDQIRAPTQKSVQITTCPKTRRPPCKDGFEVRKNPQGNECCYKKPKRKSKTKKSTPTKNKKIKITYDKNGTMKIDGRKCERLTKPVLLEVAKKMGIFLKSEDKKKKSICNALNAIEKGNSDFKIKG